MAKRPVWRPSDIKGWAPPRAPKAVEESKASPAAAPALRAPPDEVLLSVTIGEATHSIRLRWVKDLLTPDELSRLADAIAKGTSIELAANERRAAMTLRRAEA